MHARRLLFVCIAVAALAAAASGQATPQGIIVEPPSEAGLQVEIWLDNATYVVGDTIQINYRVNQAAYIYIWDIDSQGNVTQLFPNQFDPDNRVSSGTHTLPSSGTNYRLRVTQPTGTEYVQILATSEASPQALSLLGSFSASVPFPQLGLNPEDFKVQLEAQIQGVQPEPTERAFGFTSFQVSSSQQTQYGRLEVNSSPSSAEVIVDGELMGYTPLSVALTAGQHSLTLRRSGYRDFSTTVRIETAATERVDVNLTPTAANRDPVAQFSGQPSQPFVNETVRFDASGSYDPDGFLSSYRWDLDGDGRFDASGRTTSWSYASPGSYSVTLQVRDNQGATAQMTRTVTVSSFRMPGGPPVGAAAGIYVWGEDTWHVTVVGSAGWSTGHRYRLEMKTDGEFVPMDSPSRPGILGIVPEPVDEGWRLVYEGRVTSNEVTYTFQLRNASSMRMELSLDRDGDGSLESTPGMTYLGDSRVNPPFVPFVIGAPQGYEGQLIPSLNYRIGRALSYTENARFVLYRTTIEGLERR